MEVEDTVIRPGEQVFIGALDDAERAAPLAVVIHLTDLHLDPPRGPNNLSLLKQAGRMVRAAGPGRASASLGRLVQRMAGSRGTEGAWQALCGWIEDAVDALDGVPVIVVQTGDVEAFGCGPDGSFPGHGHLEDTLLAALRERPGVTVHETYGNHDIWPAVLLSLGYPEAHRSSPDRLVTAHPRLLGPWEPVDVTASDGATIRIHRVDTIDRGPVTGGLRAQGRVRPEPGVLSGWSLRPAWRLRRDLTSGPTDVDIVLTHHPLHRYSARGLGVVRGVRSVLIALQRRAIVISGHLHHKHPPPDRGLPQLVGPSPTVAPRFPRRMDPELCVYYLHRPEHIVPGTADVTDRVRIERTTYPWHGTFGGFRA